MKVLQINTVVGIGSTGRIAENIGNFIIKNNGKSYIGYGRKVGKSNSEIIKIGNNFNIIFNVIQTRLLDRHALNLSKPTLQFIKKIIELNPDIIHIHNVHGYYLNFEVLFNFLIKYNKPIVWTFHDCWPFTGHCTFFDHVKCDKWKSECNNCIQLKEYPKSILKDNSKNNYLLKKSIFSNIQNLHIVTPSLWMKNKLIDSYFRNNDARVIHNGVDLELFKPVEVDKSVFLNGIFKNKFVILGVALQWDDRKGLIEFLNLSNHLLDDELILIIGKIPNKIKAKLPSNIINIENINNPNHLNEIYSLADVFVNPTKDDNYPTTNLEALASGLPLIITSSGGNIDFSKYATVFFFEINDTYILRQKINEIKINGLKFYQKHSRQIAIENLSANLQNEKYWELYNEILV